MTTIVLDTNFLGRGQFSTAGLNKLLLVLGPGVEVVVPEVVIWEWAEHAFRLIEAVRNAHADCKVDSLLFSVPALPAVPEKAKLVQVIRSALQEECGVNDEAATVTIWQPPAEVFARSVKAQVLQTGASERKKGVKTGAADQLIVECVRSVLDGRQSTGSFLLASSDKGLINACVREFEERVVAPKGQNELLKHVFISAHANKELFEMVQEELRARLTCKSSDIQQALANFEKGFYFGPRENALSSLSPTRKEVAGLGRVWNVELHSLEMLENESDVRVGLAKIRIFADVDLKLYELDPRSRAGPELVKTFDDSLTSGWVDVTALVTFESHLRVTSFDVTSEASINFVSDEEDDDDAFLVGEVL